MAEGIFVGDARDQHPAARLQSSASALDPLFQHVIEESFGGVVVGSPFGTERRTGSSTDARQLLAGVHIHDPRGPNSAS